MLLKPFIAIFVKGIKSVSTSACQCAQAIGTWCLVDCARDVCHTACTLRGMQVEGSVRAGGHIPECKEC